MFDAYILMNKVSRRTALWSLAGTAGLLMAGCGNTTGTASGSNPTPTAVATTKPTVVTATPTIQATPTSVPAAQPGTTLLTYKGHTSAVVAVAWSADSKLVASAEQAGSIQVWEAATGKLVFICKNSTGQQLIAWSADGKYIAGTNGVGVSVWNASDGSLLTHYTAQVYVSSLAFSPDGQRIATGAHDKTVQIRQTTTGAHLLTYNGQNVMPGAAIVSISWSPDGKQIVSSSSLQGGAGPNSASVKIWDTTTGKDVLVFNNNPSNAVAWSPSGNLIASEEYVDNKNTVQIWAPQNGRGLALNVDGSGVGAQKISWSPNSKYVALALSSYQSLQPTSHVEVRSAGGDAYALAYKGHQPNVRDVAWSPDGSRIASCSDDKTVQIWQAPQ